jgi:hypothetical protein
MSVPFSVAFNKLGNVTYTGSSQTIYVTSSSPVGATFSQVYPGPTSATNIGESVSVLVTGTGRFAGAAYSGTIQVTSGGGGGGGGTLDDAIVAGNYRASNVVTFSNTVTFAKAIVALNPTGLLDSNLLVGPPPVAPFGTPVYDSTHIIVPWTIPTQIQTGFYPEPLPLLSKMNFSGLGVTVSPADSAEMVARRSNTIIFSKSGTTGIQDIVVDGVAYNNAYVQVVSPSFSSGDLIGWYSNYNTSSYNSNTVNIVGFTSAGVPGAPRNLGQAYLSTPPFQANFFIGKPVIEDSLVPTDFPGISTYRLQFSATQQLNSYGVPRDTRGDAFLSYTSSSQSITASVLYPETTYTVLVSANNKVNTSFGASTTFIINTTVLPIPTLTRTLSFAGQRYMTRAFRTSDLSELQYPLILGSLNKITSDPFEFNVMTNTDVRGTRATPATVLSAMTTVPPGPQLDFYNFGGNGSDTTSSSIGSITLTKFAYGDAYDGQPGYEGYYKLGELIVEVDLTASDAAQSIEIRQNGSLIGGTYRYYWQDCQGNPNTSASTETFVKNTLVTQYITGVNVIVGTSTFDVSVTGTTNMGTYFQPEKQVSYAFDGASFSGSRIDDPTTVTLTVAPTDFATSFPLSFTANNMNGSSTKSLTNRSILVDANSYALVTSFPAKQTPGAKKGTLRWIPGVSEVTASLPTDVASDFDHSKDITAPLYLNAMQISNGTFTTEVPSINYAAPGTFPTNTVDYRGIPVSGYRFTVFSWNAPRDQVVDLNGLQEFTFEGLTLNGAPTTIDRTTSGISLGSSSGPAMYFAFRYIDESAPTGPNFNTQWFDATDVYQGEDGTNVLKVSSNQWDVPTSDTCYLYCVVGMPMSSSVRFKFLTRN